MKRAKVMIIDDDPLNRQILTKTLEGLYSIQCFEAADEAIKWLESNSTDLILLDIMMPGMNGYEALNYLRNNPKTQSIPVVLVSANDGHADEARGFEMGAVDYIAKPFNNTVVKARVKNQLLIKHKNDLLELLASVDGLTEIPNRRYLEENLSREWRRAMREQLPLSVLMIDIDYFKQYNDHYGHQKGDETLKTVANILVSNCQRGSDFVARYGGEEFSAVLPGSDLTTAQALASKLKDLIESADIAHEASSEGRVTVSIGAASLDPTSMWSQHELIELADKGLYQAKQQGRNCIVVAQTEE